ncbi:hypothetical protein V6Z12_D02G170400 [Gossypium hirsutum]
MGSCIFLYMMPENGKSTILLFEGNQRAFVLRKGFCLIFVYKCSSLYPIFNKAFLGMELEPAISDAHGRDNIQTCNFVV